jgi:tetratricopeptide (TPR) repeat protein
LEIARAVNDASNIAIQLSEVASLQSRLGDQATARETALAALDACHESGDRAMESNLLRTLAVTELNGGLLDQAEASIRQSLAIACETDYRVAQADALYVFGMVHQAKNHHDDAHAAFVEALGIYLQIGEKRGHADTLNRLGLLVCTRDPLSARRMHVIALRAARTLGHAVLEARAWEGIGRAFVASGDIPRAIPRLRRAMDAYGRTGDHDRRMVEDLLTTLEYGDRGGTHR